MNDKPSREKSRAQRGRANEQQRATEVRGGDFIALTDPTLRKRVEELRQELSSNPQKARDFLRDAGIQTAQGNLTKRFGGSSR